MRYGLALVALILTLAGTGGVARAMQRPSSLDLRVDAIPSAVLLSRPAAQLVDPARQAGAIRRAHWTVAGWLLIQIFEAAALYYFWSSGAAASLRDALRRRMPNDWSVRFVFGAALALIARLAAFVPSFYLYRVDRTLDITFELTRLWGLYWILHTLLAMAVAGVIAAVVLGLVSRTHQWYVYTIAGILGASVAWGYVSGFVTSPGTHLVRAPNGMTVRLNDATTAGSTPPELAYDAAFEAGHIEHGDVLSIALIEAGIIVVFGALAVVIADRVRFRRDDDPLSRLALLGALLALVYIAAVPVRNAAVRSYDLSADAYAVAMTRDPASAVRALVRVGDERMLEVCPGSTATLFLYTTPGLGIRIAAINHVPSTCP